MRLGVMDTDAKIDREGWGGGGGRGQSTKPALNKIYLVMTLNTSPRDTVFREH